MKSMIVWEKVSVWREVKVSFDCGEEPEDIKQAIEMHQNGQCNEEEHEVHWDTMEHLENDYSEIEEI